MTVGIDGGPHETVKVVKAPIAGEITLIGGSPKMPLPHHQVWYPASLKVSLMRCSSRGTD